MALLAGTKTSAAAGESGRAHAAPSSEPYGHARLDWDLDLVKQAYRQAERGDIRLASDLCDALLGDDRIRSVFSTRFYGLIGSELSFEPAGYSDGRRRNKALRAIETGEDWWEIFPEDQLFRLFVVGTLLGSAFGRLVPAKRDDHGGRILPRIEVWSSRWFRFNHADNAWERDLGNGTWEPIVLGDGEWFGYMPYGPNKPWQMGLWRGLAVLWLLKRYAMFDWGHYSTRHGLGTWVISSDNGDDRKRAALAAEFGRLARDPNIALPKGVTAEFVESKANTWENFNAQIQVANIGVAVMVIGGNLAAEVDANQQTGATAQTLVRVDYKRADANALSTFANRQVLTYWAQWNFGDTRLAPWPLWQVEAKEDTRAVAETWLTVAKATSEFAKAGYRIDIGAVAVRFNIPLLPGEFAPLPDRTSEPK